MGELFKSFTKLFIKTIIIWIIMILLSNNKLKEYIEIILCLNPYYSLIYILRYLFIYERSMNYVYLNNNIYSSSINLFHLFIIILLSIYFYWIFIFYKDKIYSRSLFFFFSKN